MICTYVTCLCGLSAWIFAICVSSGPSMTQFFIDTKDFLVRNYLPFTLITASFAYTLDINPEICLNMGLGNFKTYWLALVLGTDFVSQKGALSIGFIDENTSVQTVFSPIIPA